MYLSQTWIKIVAGLHWHMVSVKLGSHVGRLVSQFHGIVLGVLGFNALVYRRHYGDIIVELCNYYNKIILFLLLQIYALVC